MGNGRTEPVIGWIGATLAGACIVALAAAGCGLFEEKPEPLEIGPPQEESAGEESQPAGTEGPETPQAPQPGGPPPESLPDSLETENLVLYAADDAPQSPELTVKKADGSTTTHQPAQEGNVVMVVCWSMAQPAGQAAALHANQLGRKYYGIGLRVLGLVSLRSGSQQGGRQAASRFLNQHGIRYQTLGLTESALSTLAYTAGKDEALPSYAIIDRKGRLRFYQRGFSYTIGGNPRFGRQVYENALYGRKIEDFLRKLLTEGRSDSDLPQRMRRGGGQSSQQSRQQGE